ncbi:Syntaxin-43 [Vitis vinifera]|uniref:Syntaxin-43 n=1 Tax=Vitis vinifera TaxID=29760 RepID=A0A438DUK4_VITVI|nr:Syntaxin-43 [Vitis vinifera]
MAELVKAHAKALMPSFGDGKEDQHRIESLTQEITDLLKKSEKRLQKLSSTGPSEDSNVRKNVQSNPFWHLLDLKGYGMFQYSLPFLVMRSLATDLQNLSMELRKKQSSYLKRLRQQKESCFLALGTSSHASFSPVSTQFRTFQMYCSMLQGQDGVDLEMNLNGNKSMREDDEFSDLGFNEHQMTKLKKNEAFTAEREREIQQVVESVNELAQIMKDLSVLVIDQGTIVDRIDYNIQNVAASVEEGFKQLQKVHFSIYIHRRENSEKGGMVMCATVLVIMCFVMLASHFSTANLLPSIDALQNANSDDYLGRRLLPLYLHFLDWFWNCSQIDSYQQGDDQPMKS